jgi:hypothetical protein
MFGVYVAPFVPMLVMAAFGTLALRRFGDRLGLTRRVWHPALFNIAVYVIVLSLVCLVFGAIGA